MTRSLTQTASTRSTRSRRAQPAPRTASVHCQVDVREAQAHLFNITLTVAQPTAHQRVSLPAWIPGSYLIREFARHLQSLSATQQGRRVAVRQLDKCSWEIACVADEPLTLRYQVYALDASVRTAWLDTQRGFFNNTSLCLRVHGQEAQPHALEIVPNAALPDWSVATGLTPQRINARGFGVYRAQDYHELVDSPVEMGAFWSGSFTVAGIPHRFVVAGAAPSWDGERLLADVKKICATEIEFWHRATPGSRARNKPPFSSYTFMLNVVDDGYGGLEHRNSTALICTRKDLPRLGVRNASEGYTTLLGLISHEYFHTWNVKRLRPAEFASYDYTQENHTELLWFFEGFTSYYDDLLLRRAGLLDDAGFLKLLNKTINQVLQTPGRRVQTVAQASWDAWTRYYRPDENTPNATVSYYTKGALVALCLDLTLRAEGPHTLDDVMRALWQRCAGGPMSQDDLLTVLAEISGRSYASELARWVHSTAELPLRTLLTQHGVTVHDDPAQAAQQLGLRVSEGAALQIKTVLSDGAAQKAGLCAGDEWLGVEVGRGKSAQAWRLNKLDELSLYAGPQKKVVALVARDKRLLRLPLTLPDTVRTWRLSIGDAATLGRWLSA